MGQDHPDVAAAIASSVRERMLQKANNAAAMFETRWTMDALYRIDPDLHEAIEDQLGMFYESLVIGEDEEIREHGEAICRGWAKAIEVMEKSGIANDAYHIGSSGDVTVAIGRQHKPPDWFAEQYGGVVWLNADECAVLYSQIKVLQEVKELWPDAKIVDVRKKGDEND